MIKNILFFFKTLLLFVISDILHKFLIVYYWFLHQTILFLDAETRKLCPWFAFRQSFFKVQVLEEIRGSSLFGVNAEVYPSFFSHYYNGTIVLQYFMNKIGNYGYSQIYSLNKRQRQDERKNHIAAVLLRKQSQIDMIKRRISALCVRDQKNVHKTLNNDSLLKRNFEIQKESDKIKQILQQKRKSQESKALQLKNKNLKSRTQNYYKHKQLEKIRQQQIRNRTQVLKKKSSLNNQLIQLNRSQQVSSKQSKSRMIMERQKQSRKERSRYLMKKRMNVAQHLKRQTDHFSMLSSVKDHQIEQLGKLQLMMIQKNQTSRAAYEVSRQRLRKKSSQVQITSMTSRTHTPRYF